MDAITLLKDDHRSLERLFKRYEQAGDRAFVEKRALVDRIIEELSRHAAIEEQLFYPVARATVPGTDDIALESLEEHHIVKWVLSELERMDPTDERFDAKVTVLIENVRHHVEEEESEFFPKVRDELGRNALGDLGDTMAKFKEVAPTHPHPTSPDTPPGNLVTGAAAGVVDHVTDTISGVAQGTVTALQDLIAGRIDVANSTMASVFTQINGGLMRAIAIGSPKRNPQLPDLPTLREQGVTDADAESWTGFFAPAATPKPALDRLSKEILASRSAVTEGAESAPALVQLAQDLKVDLPICGVVLDMIEGRLDARAAVDRLLNRPMKEES